MGFKSGKLRFILRLWNLLVSLTQLAFILVVGGAAFYLVRFANSRSQLAVYLFLGLLFIVGGYFGLDNLKAKPRPVKSPKLKGVTERPAGAQGYLQQGVTCLEERNFAGALKAFNRQLNQTPNHADAWHYKGKVLTQMGRADEASECYYKYYQLSGQLSAAKISKEGKKTARS